MGLHAGVYDFRCNWPPRWPLARRDDSECQPSSLRSWAALASAVCRLEKAPSPGDVSAPGIGRAVAAGPAGAVRRDGEWVPAGLHDRTAAGELHAVGLVEAAEAGLEVGEPQVDVVPGGHVSDDEPRPCHCGLARQDVAGQGAEAGALSLNRSTMWPPSGTGTWKKVSGYAPAPCIGTKPQGQVNALARRALCLRKPMERVTPSTGSGTTSVPLSFSWAVQEGETSQAPAVMMMASNGLMCTVT